LLKVQRMLDSDGLPQLSQDKPASLKTAHVSEILQISIFRTNHWQNRSEPLSFWTRVLATRMYYRHLSPQATNSQNLYLCFSPN
jgi:hypothetical protein